MSSTASSLNLLLSRSSADLARRDAELRYGSAHLAAYDSLAEFIKQAWSILEPSTPLVWNWHLDVLCDALEKQIAGDEEYRRLLILIPPGTAKSLVVAVFAPAWEWLRNPTRRKLFLANDDSLAGRDARRMREVVLSDWYQAVVAYVAKKHGGMLWGLARDQNEKVNFENTRRGFRQCLSLGARITGKRCDDLALDDPLDAKEIVNGSIEQVAARLQTCHNIIEKVLPNRVNNLRTARWTMIMQRLHEDDPAAHAITDGSWHVVEIQMEYDPEHQPKYKQDPRTKSGDLMFPALFPRREVDLLKAKLDTDYWSQYQQRPRPRGGVIFRPGYWRFWYPPGQPAPPAELYSDEDTGRFHEYLQAPLPKPLAELQQLQSWDMAFKKTKTSAYVVGQAWAWLGANSYLLDQVREKLDIVGSIQAVLEMTKRWPRSKTKLVESAANGEAVITMLHDKIPGLTPFDPEDDKETRARAILPFARSGNIWLPHPHYFPWVRELLDEAKKFPQSTYKDQVDAMTQALIWIYLRDHQPESLPQAESMVVGRSESWDA